MGIHHYTLFLYQKSTQTLLKNQIQHFSQTKPSFFVHFDGPIFAYIFKFLTFCFFKRNKTVSKKQISKEKPLRNFRSGSVIL